MHGLDSTRRRFVATAAFAAGVAAVTPSALRAAESEGEVDAVEDLMREHGVLRRVLLAYVETVPKLRTDPGAVDAKALNDAALVFHEFGEVYHERKLEEAYLFPRLEKVEGMRPHIEVLLNQHARGRQITEYVLRTTRHARIANADAEPLARVFEEFARMYANHTAREDTEIFPAWKAALSLDERRDFQRRFEAMEEAQFGEGGFTRILVKVADVEQRLGLADLAQFTAEPPPA